MAMFEYLRRAMLAGYGMQEKFNEFVDELVKKGELSKAEGVKLVKEWSEKAEKSGGELSKGFEDLMASALKKLNIPNKDEIEKLEKKVQALSARVKALEDAKAG